MKKEHASKLALALSLGYTIIIECGPYVTGPVTSIDADEDEERWVYSDDTVDERNLDEIGLDEVKVFQRIDFISEELEQQAEDHEFEYNLNKPTIQKGAPFDEDLKGNYEMASHISEEEDDDVDMDGPGNDDAADWGPK